MKKKNPNTMTPYGNLHKGVLEELQNNYDTSSLVRAVDHVDFVINQIEEIREDLIKLHKASMDLINEDFDVDDASKLVNNDISLFALDLDDRLFDCIESLEGAQEAVDPLKELAADEEWDWE